MKLKVINQKAFERLVERKPNDGPDDVLACDGGCGCDSGSDWVNQVCPAPEWVVGWKKATC